MFGFGKELNFYWRSLLRILYPPRCIFCELPLLLEETDLCRACTKKIEPLKSPTCLKCAHPMAPYEGRGSVCSSCRSERPHFDRGFALTGYAEPIRQLFHQIKFQKKLWLLGLFSRLLEHSSIAHELNRYDLLIPVPLDWWRERQRGFNQAALIAEMLKRSGGNPKLQITRCIQKKKRTPPQSKLRRDERLKNLNGVFQLKNSRLIRGKHILLVDDIFTTGSTINECAKLLKANGAEHVDFFSIARS